LSGAALHGSHNARPGVESSRTLAGGFLTECWIRGIIFLALSTLEC
jgi:hypothetical protein